MDYPSPSNMPQTRGAGGGGAGGNGSPGSYSTNATENTGSGGGGSGSTNYQGSAGASGIVVVRYKIGSVSTAKATGGSASFYGGKTIHTFVTSGTFATAPNWSAVSVEYVVIGGGGGGGATGGGGSCLTLVVVVVLVHIGLEPLQ